MLWSLIKGRNDDQKNKYGPSVAAAFVTLMSLAAPAHAGVLEPLIEIFAGILTDLEQLFSALGGLAILVGFIAMLFGKGNAWSILIAGVIIVLGANYEFIIGILTA